MQDKDTEISRLKSELKKRDKEIESLNNKIECDKVDKKELRAALKKKVVSSVIRSREQKERISEILTALFPDIDIQKLL